MFDEDTDEPHNKQDGDDDISTDGGTILGFFDTFHPQPCACLDRIREKNPGKRILLVLDNFSSHICPHTCRRAHQLGVDLVFIPVGSPDLNPTELVLKSLRWEASPLIVESAEEE